MSMLKRFLPRKDVFFALFGQLAEKVEVAAQEFNRLLAHLPEAALHAKQISAIEKQGDQVTRRIFDELHKTFVTPYDRIDMSELTSNLDDIIDQINRVARRVALYQVLTIPLEVLMVGQLAVQAAGLLNQSVAMLEKSSKPKQILHLCDNVSELQESADKILSTGMSQLFAHENDFKTLLKMKEIYELIASVFDRYQDVAYTLKGIVLEYS